MAWWGCVQIAMQSEIAFAFASNYPVRFPGYGKKFKSLTRHLRTQYQMTPDQYRAKWDLPADQPNAQPVPGARVM